MPLLIAILTLALAAFVVLLVSAPLRRAPRASAGGSSEPGAGECNGAGSAARETLERDQLEAAREAKYREIRDCELDFRTGKLSRADYEATNAQLRAEALAILERLQAAPAGDGVSEPADGPAARDEDEPQEL